MEALTPPHLNPNSANHGGWDTQASGKPLAQSNFDPCMVELLAALAKKGVRPRKAGCAAVNNEARLHSLLCNVPGT